jgi:hypothetical protein
MKDDFLRSYRKMPRQEFADRLYQRLSGKKPKGPSPARYVLVWALATVLFALGLTYNTARLPSQRVFYETPPAASQEIRQAQAPQSIRPRDQLPESTVYYQPTEAREVLGPFDAFAPPSSAEPVEQPGYAMAQVQFVNRR